MNQFFYLERVGFEGFHTLRCMENKPDISEDRLSTIRARAEKLSDATYVTDNQKVVDGIAYIKITGVLIQSASWIDEYYAEYYGENFTSYAGLLTQIAVAEANPYVEKIVFNTDSPGGDVAGVDNVAQAIARCSKPTEVRIGFYCCSAAYYLASQAGKIYATNPNSTIGSIGVVVSMVDARKMYAKFGIEFYDLTSDEAPKKRQIAHSDEFKQQIRDQLNSYHGVFAGRVSEGRTKATGDEISVNDVNADFGRGGVMLAEDAITAGMIDGMIQQGVITGSSTKNPEEKMGQEVLTAEEQATAVTAAQEAGFEAGTTAEQGRVSALMPWMSVDSERVTKAISEGETLTPALMNELSATAAAAAVVPESEGDLTEAEKAEAKAREDDKVPPVSGVDTDEQVSADEKADAELLASVKQKSRR